MLQFFQTLPLIGILALMVFVSVAAYAAGRRLGWRHHADVTQKAEAPLSATVAAIMGLSAFMLAFSFGVASGLFKERISLVVDEAADIDKVYLRAGYLEEPHRTDIRNLLREYLQIRTTDWTSLEEKKRHCTFRKNPGKVVGPWCRDR